MARKKITQVTAKEIEDIINNSVQSAKNRLVGNAAEQKKMFVRPIANTDGSPNVAKLVQRLASETEEAMQQLENNVEDLEDSLVAPPPADSVPLAGVFLEYDRETETLEILGERGIGEEDVIQIVGDETSAKFNALDGAVANLDEEKEDKISFADGYDPTTNKAATEATVAKEVARVVGGAGESFDTLKEIADWIMEHPNSVAAINAAIAENTDKINTHTRDIALNTSKVDRNTSDIAAQAQRITSVQSSVNALSTSKQDKLSIADGYSSENPVATVRTVSDKIAEVVGGADASFDTLKEIADWINNNPESVAAINAMLSEHAEAIAGNAEGIYQHSLEIEELEETIEQVDNKATQNSNGVQDNARRIGIAEADIAVLRDTKQNVLMFADEYNEDSKVATERTVEREVAKIVADAPDNFNTLKEIATWIAEHPNDIAQLNALIYENREGIRLNSIAIDNNRNKLSEQAEQIYANEVGLRDLTEYHSRLASKVEDKADKNTVATLVDTVVNKTDTPNQLYGTDENGNQVSYPTDSVGTQVYVGGQKVQKFNADSKFSVDGGHIFGDVFIDGSLGIAGPVESLVTETLLVEDNVIVANSNGRELVGVSGFAIKTGDFDLNGELAYGIMYVPYQEPYGQGVKIGLGGFTSDGKFTFLDQQAQFLATRADDIKDGFIPKWDDQRKMFVQGLEESEIVRKTDYASSTAYGVVKTYYNQWSSGLTFINGMLAVYGAEKSVIDEKVNTTCPIVPYVLDYAVMSSLADCKDTTLWTDDSTDDSGAVVKGTKTKARETIGAVKKPTLPTASGIYAVTINKDGITHIQKMSTSASANNVPISNSKGNIKTNTPEDDLDCANKKYVDDGFVVKNSVNIETKSIGNILNFSKHAATIEFTVPDNVEKIVKASDTIYIGKDKIPLIVISTKYYKNKSYTYIHAGTSSLSGYTISAGDSVWIKSLLAINDARVKDITAREEVERVEADYFNLLQNQLWVGDGNSPISMSTTDTDGRTWDCTIFQLKNRLTGKRKVEYTLTSTVEITAAADPVSINVDLLNIHYVLGAKYKAATIAYSALLKVDDYASSYWTLDGFTWDEQSDIGQECTPLPFRGSGGFEVKVLTWTDSPASSITFRTIIAKVTKYEK